MQNAWWGRGMAADYDQRSCLTSGAFRIRSLGWKNKGVQRAEKVSLFTDEQVLEFSILKQGLWRLLGGKTWNLHDSNLKQSKCRCSVPSQVPFSAWYSFAAMERNDPSLICYICGPGDWGTGRGPRGGGGIYSNNIERKSSHNTKTNFWRKNILE